MQLEKIALNFVNFCDTALAQKGFDQAILTNLDLDARCTTFSSLNFRKKAKGPKSTSLVYQHYRSYTIPLTRFRNILALT